MAKNNFYGVKVGLVPGVYDNWPECQENVKGVPGATYKGFPTREEAEAFVGVKAPEPMAMQELRIFEGPGASVQAALDLFGEAPAVVEQTNGYCLNIVNESDNAIMATVTGTKENLEYIASALVNADIGIGFDVEWETSVLMLGDHSYMHTLNVKGTYPTFGDYVQPVTFGSKGSE